MLTNQEKDEVIYLARQIMLSYRNVEWEGWKQLVEDELLERGWSIEKQQEALKLVGLFKKKTL
ncbi:hypothetical protein [Aneurinibacillus aneurinilyticus]|jgi:hypothetical protein|uniref:Uncharacterized protein n=2 Tax=Aneurinibacillus aneurinilyticus TaxID=1391 RepID=A0A848CUH8_ANEAE|nr:hypothetical protein [Aneurinibacillus aneurinilyticus]ERI09482.1 hypothetical protein HMPREF0083_02437 [Aneurinibacillus aneurinilyticus ATCC 12856]MCI1693799.1 hypothetical protein [Aneurinibacillus aneurinilyticus]MED0672078.1 hypothetical protein [Aneurinibacillus aneurinilyticus]MED0709663.1 hypothetical protein [Aneurinibacillus aneurinilyticus]MED0726377.1 hypothetical protein [Aneurinibacillus aneurinilyticus]